MKKFKEILMSMMLVLSLVFSLAACSVEHNVDKEQQQSSGEANEASEESAQKSSDGKKEKNYKEEKIESDGESDGNDKSAFEKEDDTNEKSKDDEESDEREEEKSDKEYKDSDSKNERPSVPQKDAEQIWHDFLKSGEYTDFICEGYEDNMFIEEYLEYVIVDLDNDNNSELMITTHNGELEFYFTWLFVLDNGEIEPAYHCYGYAQFMYSQDYERVIVSPNFRPFKDTSSYPFYELNGTEFEMDFCIFEDGGEFFRRDDSETIYLTEEEHRAYFNNITHFEWNYINSL